MKTAGPHTPFIGQSRRPRRKHPSPINRPFRLAKDRACRKGPFVFGQEAARAGRRWGRGDGVIEQDRGMWIALWRGGVGADGGSSADATRNYGKVLNLSAFQDPCRGFVPGQAICDSLSLEHGSVHVVDHGVTVGG